MREVATIVGGGTPDTGVKENFGGDIAWLTPADLSGYSSKVISRGTRSLTKRGYQDSGAQLMPAGSVLFSSRAPIGYVAIAANPISTNQGFKSFVPERELSSDFIYYYLLRAKPLATKLASGTTFLEISGKNAAIIPIPIPPPAEQTRIAAKLDELLSDLDAGVAALAGVRAKLKHYRAAVLKTAVEGALTADLPCRQAGWRDPKFRNCSGSRVPENSDAFFAYVLEYEDGSLYKGFCQNLWARIDRHLDGRGAEWTSKHKPVALVHFEKFDTMAEAREREVYFKSGSGREWLAALWKERKPATESAAGLLTRILAERRRRWEEAQLQKFKEQGKAPPKNWPACRTGRKDKYQEPSVPDTTHLPKLPEAWCWASVEEISSEIRNGFSGKPDAVSGVPILRISAVRAFALDLSDRRFLRGAADDYRDDQIETNDLLFTRYNGSRNLVGVCAVVPAIGETIVHPDKLIRARPVPSDAVPSFIGLAANVGASRKYVEQRIRTTAGQAGISGGDVKTLPIPFPPAAEQTAIVELVEDQLSVIDHLEADLDAKLKSAQALRQSILRSAFEGRLVPQDPNDEPAGELLKRIAAEREARAKAAKANKTRAPRKRALNA